jgi:hypothetical protein
VEPWPKDSTLGKISTRQGRWHFSLTLNLQVTKLHYYQQKIKKQTLHQRVWRREMGEKKGRIRRPKVNGLARVVECCELQTGGHRVKSPGIYIEEDIVGPHSMSPPG